MVLTTLLTVTSQVAVFPPSSVVAVMVAVPTFTAVTLPCSSTVATFSLSDVQVTFLLVVFGGLIVAVIFLFSQLSILILPVPH